MSTKDNAESILRFLALNARDETATQNEILANLNWLEPDSYRLACTVLKQSGCIEEDIKVDQRPYYQIKLTDFGRLRAPKRK